MVVVVVAAAAAAIVAVVAIDVLVVRLLLVHCLMITPAPPGHPVTEISANRPLDILVRIQFNSRVAVFLSVSSLINH